jgi:DNA-binding LacI/PurR family transcriptional regulator
VVHRAVPGDVSVVGFDDILLAGYLWPPLTTVAQDFDEIGRRLVARLLQQVRSGEVEDDGDTEDLHEVIPVELLVRQSTAPPR